MLNCYLLLYVNTLLLWPIDEEKKSKNEMNIEQPGLPLFQIPTQLQSQPPNLSSAPPHNLTLRFNVQPSAGGRVLANVSGSTNQRTPSLRFGLAASLLSGGLQRDLASIT